jgi:SOS response regulatory protein OraA/RecX
MLRIFFRHDKKLFSEISRIISGIVQDYYNELSGKVLTTGIVVSFQTYGDMLRFHPHWHCIILEGGVNEERFYHLSVGDTKPLCEVFRQKVIRYFTRKGLLNEQMASSLLTWVNSGFSVDNSVRLLSQDNKARSNLSQYIARHPYSLKKIHTIREKGQVLYLTQYNPALKDNIKLFAVLDFIAELTQHIPPKGKHLIRYYGLYSSRTMGKNNALGKLEKFKVKDAAAKIAEKVKPEAAKAEKKKCNKTWARLIQKVYEVDPLECPKCGGSMKIVAVITEPLAVQSILRHLGKNHLPPFNLPKANSPPGK